MPARRAWRRSRRAGVRGVLRRPAAADRRRPVRRRLGGRRPSLPGIARRPRRARRRLLVVEPADARHRRRLRRRRGAHVRSGLTPAAITVQIRCCGMTVVRSVLLFVARRARRDRRGLAGLAGLARAPRPVVDRRRRHRARRCTASSPPSSPTRTSAASWPPTAACSSPDRWPGAWSWTGSAPTGGTSSAPRSACSASRSSCTPHAADPACRRYLAPPIAWATVSPR